MVNTYLINQKGIYMKEGNKKSAVITLRCTPDVEKRIKNKAGQLGKPVSEIVMEYINEGLKKNTRYDKQRARVLVETQEMLNTLISGLGRADNKQISERLKDISKGMIKLWDY